MTTHKSGEVVCQRLPVNLDVSRNIFRDSKILVGHVARIDHIHEHQRLLLRGVDKNIAALVIDAGIVQSKSLIAETQLVRIYNSNGRERSARVFALCKK